MVPFEYEQPSSIRPGYLDDRRWLGYLSTLTIHDNYDEILSRLLRLCEGVFHACKDSMIPPFLCGGAGACVY